MRLRDLGESGDAAWRDKADQAVWSAFNAGLVASYAGGLVYARLGLRVLCGAVALVAAPLACLHAAVALAEWRAPSYGDRGFRKLLRSLPVARMVLPCGRTLESKLLGVRAVILTATAATFITTVDWQLAAVYYRDRMGQPPVAVFAVMVACTLVIINGPRVQRWSLWPCVGRQPRDKAYGPELMLWALAAVVGCLAVFVVGAAGPAALQMAAHGACEFYVDFSLRCSTRMLDATCEAGGYRYASFAVLYQIAGLGARLAASLAAPALYAYVHPEAPFLLNVVVATVAMAETGHVFIFNLSQSIHDLFTQLVDARHEIAGHVTGKSTRRRSMERAPSRQEIAKTGYMWALGVDATAGLPAAPKARWGGLRHLVKDSVEINQWFRPD